MMPERCTVSFANSLHVIFQPVGTCSSQGWHQSVHQSLLPIRCCREIFPKRPARPGASSSLFLTCFLLYVYKIFNIHINLQCIQKFFFIGFFSGLTGLTKLPPLSLPSLLTLWRQCGNTEIWRLQLQFSN